MKKLTNYQLAFLYLLLFNIGESDVDDQEVLETPINELLLFNNMPTDYVADEDGGPITAPDEVYKAYCDKILYQEMGEDIEDEELHGNLINDWFESEDNSMESLIKILDQLEPNKD